MKLFITALLLMAGTLSPVGAANWVPLPASESAEVDTDSYVDSGVRASMDLKLSLDGTSVISTMEFDKDRRNVVGAAVLVKFHGGNDRCAVKGELQVH